MRIWRLVAVMLFASHVACGTTYRKARPDLPLRERGAAELSALVEEFDRSLEEADFGKAEDILAELKDGVRNADMATISHSEYGDISDRVSKGGRAIAKAKREHAVANMIARIREQQTVAQRQQTALEQDFTRKKAIDEVADSVEALRELLEEGRAYVGHPAYRDVAAEVKELVAALDAMVSRARWVLRATTELMDALEGLALQASNTSATPQEQIQRAERAEAAYGKCLDVCDELVKSPGYMEDQMLETQLGAVTIEQARATCTQGQMDARGSLSQSKIALEIAQALAPLDDAWSTWNEQQAADSKLKHIKPTVSALEVCAKKLAIIETRKRYDDGQRHPTPFGKLSGRAARERCDKERTRLVGLAPTLHWRLEVDKLRQEVEQAKSHVEEAVKKDKDADKLDSLQAGLDGLRACAEHAKALSNLKQSSWNGAKPSRSEFKDLKSIGQLCKRDQKGVAKLLRKAKKRSQSK